MGKQPQRSKDPSSAPYAMLDEAGFVSVVATNVEYVFHRYLKLGDVISGRTKLVDVSEEKATGLGIGHFVTTETEYVDENDEPVGSMFFRILKFRPGTGRVNKNQTRKQKRSKQQALIPTTTSLHRNDLPAQGHNGTKTKNGFGKASKTMSYEFGASPTMER